MSAEEAKVFLRELLDGEAMRSPEVNQHVRKMLRGQRDQVARLVRGTNGAWRRCRVLARASRRQAEDQTLSVLIACQAEDRIVEEEVVCQVWQDPRPEW